jgi:hypothetical protein
MSIHTPALAEEVVGPDEGAVVSAFVEFLKAASTRHHPTGTMPRFNQGRAAGCVDAEFIVAADLPPELRVGLFAEPWTYPARIRFANASSTSDTDRDVRGMSIKVSRAAEQNLTAGIVDHDFILNSHPVMMVGQTSTFLDLLKAVEEGGIGEGLFFVTHPRAAAVALASRQHATSHLEIPYWSTTPYLFGPGRAVKYSVRPVSSRTTALPNPLTDDYLHERLAAHLAHEEVQFDFRVQFQRDSRKMPIEDASVEWREDDSPFLPVARIRIPVQQVDTPGAPSCETLSFNPWHARAEHRPLGDLNRARREMYRAMAAFRGAQHA